MSTSTKWQLLSSIDHVCTHIPPHIREEYHQVNRKGYFLISLKSNTWKQTLNFITATLFVIAANVALNFNPSPALAQFTPPTGNTVSCLGFFCNVASAIVANAVFQPISGVINGVVTLGNVIFVILILFRAYQIWRKADRGDDWGSDAMSLASGSGFVVVIALVSLGFIQGGQGGA